MKFLLRLIFNRFILSLLIFTFFFIDYKFVQIEPLAYYNIGETEVLPTSYYEVPLGKAHVYVYVSVDGDKIYLNTSNAAPIDALTLKHEPLLQWYYYLAAIGLVSVIPFNIFFKKNKKNDKKKNK